ncbi:FecCD family ABC transporter permease [Paenibacillus sp. NPDC058174]|uniref:FecCD family ABC transporter permease n=1 Tax=Paenibacillus sp. NPDC058174 TaxID=3346366 RepID=UPI0036DD7A75
MSKYSTIRTNKPKLSLLLERKTVLIAVVLLVLCAAAAVLSTGIGSKFIAPLDVVKSIFGYGNPMHDVIVLKLRLPRIIIALLVGAALASAGAVLQGLIRNPLASPDVAGITEGASLGTVLFMFFFNEKLSIQWMPLAAIIGAFAVTFLLYVLSWKDGASPLRMVLIGTGLSAAFKSISYMLLISGPFFMADRALTFMTGSIYGASWEKDVFTLLPWLVVLLPLTWLMSRHVNIQSLGDEVAGSAGASVQRHRLLLLILSVSLAGAAVAIGGAIAFVGLIAPHIARKLVGSSFGGLLPVSAMIGALLVLLSDLAARTLFTPLDIPAGVFTAIIGAPFFLYLLYRHRNQ